MRYLWKKLEIVLNLLVCEAIIYWTIREGGKKNPVGIWILFVYVNISMHIELCFSYKLFQTKKRVDSHSDLKTCVTMLWNMDWTCNSLETPVSYGPHLLHIIDTPPHVPFQQGICFKLVSSWVFWVSSRTAFCNQV